MKFFLSILFVLGYGTGLVAQKFTLPVFPDTQTEVSSNNPMFFSRFDWIVDKRDSLNIPMVLGVGDVVNFDNYNHWEVASKGFEKFDNHKMPYSMVLGNHDTEAVGVYTGSAAPGNVNQNLRKTKKFNSFFPLHRFQNLRGTFEPGKADNAYYTFKIKDTNFLVLTIEFCPRQEVINWASDVCKEFFDYNVIVTTHYFLTPRGEISESNAGYGDFSAQFMYMRLVRPNPNVKLVLSGHVSTSAWRVDKRADSTKIHSILQNYQNEDSGGGYIRLLSIDIDKGTIAASMYSPFYNKTKEDKSKFVIEGVSFINNKEIQEQGIKVEAEKRAQNRPPNQQSPTRNQNRNQNQNVSPNQNQNQSPPQSPGRNRNRN